MNPRGEKKHDSQYAGRGPKGGKKHDRDDERAIAKMHDVQVLYCAKPIELAFISSLSTARQIIASNRIVLFGIV
jgi:hypothetical protein